MAEEAAAALMPGECLVLENLRFHHEEEKGDPGFARALAKLADVYVNDAFGTAHRDHASVTGVSRHLPSAVGLLMSKELSAFAALDESARPFVAILGGAKVSDKLPVMENLLPRLDVLIIGTEASAKNLSSEDYNANEIKARLQKASVMRGLG